MTRKQRDEQKGQRSEWRPITNGRGEVKGYIEMFWHAPTAQWMTIPGQSRYRNA
jgi:hypothetical protein